MKSLYQSLTQTGILLVLTITATDIFEKLTDINNSLMKIENQIKYQSNYCQKKYSN